MNNVISKNQPQRLVGLDLFRILSAYVVFLFHTQIHTKCYYGILDDFIRMGAIFMTGFFMMSGWVLYHNYSQFEFNDWPTLKKFYLKRLIGILPLYYVVAFMYIIILDTRFMTKTDKILDNLLLAPIEILGLQSYFSTLFPFTHNGGSWFISCLFTGYFIFPLLQKIIKNVSNTSKFIIITLCSLILLIAPFIVHHFKTTDIYSNPFFRVLEFTIGIILASWWHSSDKTSTIFIKKAQTVAITATILLIIGISLAVKLGIPKNYMLYNWLALPMFMIIIQSCAYIESDFLVKSKNLKYLSGISFAVFLAQFFTTPIAKKIFSFFEIEINYLKIIIIHLLLIIISVFLHEIIEKSLAKKLRK